MLVKPAVHPLVLPPIVYVLNPGTFGIGTVIIGLTLALPSSVAPNGMLLPERDVPGLEGDEALPLENDPPSVQPLAPEPPPVVPPPSKVEFIAAEPLVIPDEEDPELQSGDLAGLRPPVLISIAPSPMPAPINALGADGPVEAEMPSGDVVPIAGVLIGLCAAAAPQLNKIAAAIAGSPRIVDLLNRVRAAMAACGSSPRGADEQGTQFDRSVCRIGRERASTIKLAFRTLNSNLEIAPARVPRLEHFQLMLPDCVAATLNADSVF